MKKYLMILMLAILGITQMAAQEYEYVPFVREGVKWVCDAPYYFDYSGTVLHDYYTLEINGDTVIDGKTYKAMHKFSGDAINLESDTILIYLREEGKVIYGIVPDGKIYNGFPIGMGYDSVMVSKMNKGEEFVLYDFNAPDTFIKNSFHCDMETDVITIAGKKKNRYIIDTRHGHNMCIIESIGCDGFIHGNPLTTSGAYILAHVIENGDTIYTSEHFKHKPESDSELPIPRRGVQWVNERVIIEHGDTSSYYYKYEFRGVNQQGFAQCFTYTSDTLDYSTAGVVALYQSWDYGLDTSNGMLRYNGPFNKVKKDNRDMVDYNSTLDGYLWIYHFDEITYSDISSDYPPAFYIHRQKENFLNRQNFVRVEPLIIENVLCDRFAYIGEEGDTLAYVVEGIGFDSRDMGDLLTPFTRKPDPNADYQEYCGLSHVVKDGKIIYKGMRYRHGAFDAIDEVVADQTRRPANPHYYNLMGQPVGTEVPTAPGIYIHNGKKIIVR